MTLPPTKFYFVVMNNKVVNVSLDKVYLQNFCRIHANTDLTKNEKGHYLLKLEEREFTHEN